MEILKVESTEDKLNYLLETKTKIRQAIIDQGGTITDKMTFRQYVDEIAKLNVIDQEVLDDILEALKEISEIEDEQNEHIQEIVTVLNKKLEDSDLDEIRTDISSNKTKIEANEVAISTLNDKTTEMENKVADLGDGKADAEELEKTNANVQLNKTAIETNTADINAIKTRIETDEESITANTTNITKNASDISDIKSDMEDVTKSISDNKTAIETNASDISDIKYEITDLDKSIKDNTKAISDNKKEFDKAVEDINKEVEKRLTTEAAKPLIKSIEYNNTTATFTFTDMEGNEKVVDLPLESTVKSGKYDSEKKAMVLVLQSDDEIEIPVVDLVDVYTGLENSKIKVVVNNKNEIEAQLKTASIEKSDLVSGLKDELEAKATKEYVDQEIGTINDSIKEVSDNLDEVDEKVTAAETKIAELETSGDSLEEDLETANTNIATNASNIASLKTKVEEDETTLAQKVSMKELGDELAKSAKATSSENIVPKIFSDIQFSHKYRLMLPYITIGNTGKVSYGFQDILSNSQTDADTNPVVLEFVKDENDDDIKIKVTLDKTKLEDLIKVEKVNNVEPDENKNITLKAENIKCESPSSGNEENLQSILYSIDGHISAVQSEMSGSIEPMARAGYEAKAWIDYTGNQAISDIEDEIKDIKDVVIGTGAETGDPVIAAIKTINGKEPNSDTRDIQIDASDINVDKTATTKKTVKKAIEDLEESVANAGKVETVNNKAVDKNTKNITLTGDDIIVAMEQHPDDEKGILEGSVANAIINLLEDSVSNKNSISSLNNSVVKKVNGITPTGINKEVVLDASNINVDKNAEKKKTIKEALEGVYVDLDQVETELESKIDAIVIPEVPEYSIVESTTVEGYAKTYSLTKDGEEVGAKINIPKDLVIDKGEVKTVTEVDKPYEGAVVGDKYIDLTLNDTTKDHIYIPVKDLVDTYIGKDGDKINITINNKNEIEATIKAGTIEKADLVEELQAKIDEIESNTQAILAEEEARIATDEQLAGSKVDMIEGINKIYGTNSEGVQTAYDKDDFGKVDTINGIEPDTNKNIQIDASKINLDDETETKETLKAVIEAQATKIASLEEQVAELVSSLGDIKTALELLNGENDVNDTEY